MSCFNRCFGSSKDANAQRNRNKRIPKTQRHGMQNAEERKTLIEYGIQERAIVPVNDDHGECVPEERLSASPTKKRVTFNSNVKVYEPVLVCDSTDSLLDEVREVFKENIVKLKDDDLGSGNDMITSSVGSFPQNHRYQNCQESDYEAEEYGDSDLDYEEHQDGDDVEGNGDIDVGRSGGCQHQEVCPESVVTELEVSRTKNHLLRVNSEEVNSPFEAPKLADEGNRVKAGYARDRSTHIRPVLNPVENLTQWKALKSKGTPPSLKSQKENSMADIEAPQELTCKLKHLSPLPRPKSKQFKTSDQDVAVDASLSNWLISPYTTPVKKTNQSSGVETIASDVSGSQCSSSVVSFEDRPILGALTMEALRHVSATKSPRKSPTHSPDEQLIIGTVGTYWNTRTQ